LVCRDIEERAGGALRMAQRSVNNKLNPHVSSAFDGGTTIVSRISLRKTTNPPSSSFSVWVLPHHR
jgi:hypothetical protein